MPRMNIRISDTQRKAWEKQAMQLNIPLSSYIRQRVDGIISEPEDQLSNLKEININLRKAREELASLSSYLNDLGII